MSGISTATVHQSLTEQKVVPRLALVCVHPNGDVDEELDGIRKRQPRGPHAEAEARECQAVDAEEEGCGQSLHAWRYCQPDNVVSIADIAQAMHSSIESH